MAYKLEIKTKSDANPKKIKTNNNRIENTTRDDTTIPAKVKKMMQDHETANLPRYKLKIKTKCDTNPKKSKINNTDAGSSKANNTNDYQTLKSNPETKKRGGSRDSPAQPNPGRGPTHKTSQPR